ncbi:hypothetical protein Poli38472_000547 [Pythium oligandrum]|uniref:Phospholipid-transporting ATPase n=1 Tax=Pythium oligandrum TaxID=41045 RepID=A0A8K1CCB5_PYTOL|nr:hypothetical protein Poli38472_000547 [Pythium oligandrum]|eukprot:TMW60505.1 hypothetical protein Poli38472_000547 [Pythium oligandrum]
MTAAVQVPAAEYRVVQLNDRAKNAETGYCNNFIVTSKYTVISFVPKFLFETFRKLGNLYFLLVCILQCIPEISNTNGQPSTLLPLLFIIVVDAVFAILEDHKRHIADNIANARPTHVLNPSSKTFVSKPWADVVVGDVIKLHNRDLVPADILLLAVSEIPNAPPTGLCYVETKSLDGETNMKVRSAMECTMSEMGEINNILKMKGVIRCEHPNNAINSFQGVLELEGRQKQSIPYESIVLRGCIIRNTDWVHGVVFNTGKDTKIMMSNSAPPSKMSTMDQVINHYIMVLLVILILFSVAGASGSVLWKTNNDKQWYLALEVSNRSGFVEWIVMMFYYLLLLYQFVPISLSVSMSMVKYIQAQFIQWDKEIYYAETDTPTLVRSMSLNEELGQISYIFSDKTGTLTCNVMEFRKCSIGGVSYGHGTTEIGLAAMKRSGKTIPEVNVDPNVKQIPYVNFYGPELFKDMEGASGPEQKERIDAFFTHLAVCHTVIPERHENSTEITLSASSPDEQALVAGASFFGYQFTNRTPGVAHVAVHGAHQQFETLDVLEFNSTRKRMSMIIRHPNGRIFLYSKGADVIIYGRLSQMDLDNVRLQEITKEHIDIYADEGLRTLTIAYRELNPDYYATWAARFHAAQNDLAEIDKRKKDQPNEIDKCMDEVETDLGLLGATAIEDKLQQGVPDTIANLAVAGIKIWVLTGDKEETAINIGFACQLLTNEMKIVIINAKNCPTPERIEEELTNQSGARGVDVQMYLDFPPNARRELKDLALVIDGETLIHALSGKCRYLLANFSQYCKAVIACRVSPAQKAQMVALIKEFVPGVRTLAIGDGANDVSMIQEAHIGVGISGQEGMQAVNSSDYAIARFRFLERLLLVHGRWNYRRMARLVLYIFYKNILSTAAQYWYTCMCGFSGQKFYLETGIQLYNISLTALPIVVLSIFDQDVSDTMAMTFPKLYTTGPRDEDLNTKIFSSWVLAAIAESITITVITVSSLQHAGMHGTSATMWLEGNIVFTLVVVIANVKLMLYQNSFLLINHVLYWGSIIFWVLVGFVAGNIPALSDLTWEKMMERMFDTTCFWLLLLLVPVAALSHSYLGNGIKVALFPEYWQLVKESVKFDLDRKLLAWEDASVAAVPMPVPPRGGRGVYQRAGLVVPTNSSGARTSGSKGQRLTFQKGYHGFAFSMDTHASMREAQLMMKDGAKT